MIDIRSGVMVGLILCKIVVLSLQNMQEENIHVMRKVMSVFSVCFASATSKKVPIMFSVCGQH
jgi:hypothetical protein